MAESIAARDPLNSTSHYDLGVLYLYGGRAQDGIASLHRALALNPEHGAAHAVTGIAFLTEGQPEAALREFEQESDAGWRLIGLPMAYHALGRRQESDAALAELIAKHERDSAYNIAQVMTIRGQPDLAFEWLEKAIAYGDPGMSEVHVSPLFAGLRADRRWLPFLRKLGRAPEQLAEIPFDVGRIR